MTEFKTIPTQYAGILFRTRGEARYAAAFDAVGIPWEYEPEGYEFDDGTKYLPDFKLKVGEQDIYCEVKREDPNDFDIHKMNKFRMAGFSLWILPSRIPKNYEEAVDIFHFSNGLFFSFRLINGDYYTAFLYRNYYSNSIQFGGPDWDKFECGTMNYFFSAARNQRFEKWDQIYDVGSIISFKNLVPFDNGLQSSRCFKDSKTGIIIGTKIKKNGKQSALILLKDFNVRRLDVDMMKTYNIEILEKRQIKDIKNYLFMEDDNE